MARTKPAIPSVSQETHDVVRSLTATIEPRHATALIEIPLAEEVHDPVPHFVEVALRSAGAKSGMARLRDGLIASGALLPGTSRRVESNADAIRYLLEQLAAAN